MRAIRRRKKFRKDCAAWGTSSNLTVLSQSLTTTADPAALAVFSLSWLTSPLSIVIIISLVIGLLMVVLFGYTSDQKAIGVAKDQLKAHLLAVRLYRDQIPVVMGSYGKILRGTGRYLKLAFKPLLYVIIPIILLMVQIDRYLGQTPIAVNAPFLITVHLSDQYVSSLTPGALNSVTLDLPPEITMTAPALHISAESEIVWRLVASHEGKYEVKFAAAGQSATKSVCVGSDLARISSVRLRGHSWERMFSSAEPALPENGPIQSISIN